VAALLVPGSASAQDKGTLNPQPLPPMTKPEGRDTPANQLFARKTTPAAMPARSIGFYSKGCLAGGVELPISGETWQVMRASRNRNWGHPALVRYIEHLSERAARSGWPGLLVGDMSQPRGGPMLSHFHIRLNCPADSPQCEPLPVRDAGDRCQSKEMHRFSSEALPEGSSQPRAGPKMTDLPKACREVLDAP
jgi:murein endopeptidase